MNIDQFLTAFPEFADTDASLVNAKLVEASLELDLTNTWGPFSTPGQPQTVADTAHGYLTAHKLALSPMGQNARLIPQDGVTTYKRHFDDLVRKTTIGVFVTDADNMSGSGSWCT